MNFIWGTLLNSVWGTFSGGASGGTFSGEGPRHNYTKRTFSSCIILLCLHDDHTHLGLLKSRVSFDGNLILPGEWDINLPTPNLALLVVFPHIEASTDPWHWPYYPLVPPPPPPPPRPTHTIPLLRLGLPCDIPWRQASSSKGRHAYTYVTFT